MSVAISSFLVFAASQVGTPGPANMALLAAGARYGLMAALPFVAGVVLGKQLIIWPIGFGLMQLAQQAPLIFEALKWISAAYICWLAWKIANLRLATGLVAVAVPGFLAGLLVHPLNPKAWAMITTGFTAYVTPGADSLQATAIIATCLMACQLVLHPIWTYGGDRIARVLGGGPNEKYLMWSLAALTVASVLFVLFGGAKA